MSLLLAPAAAAGQEPIYELSQLTAQPGIANANQARRAITRSYSSNLQNQGLQGRVDVTFVVNTDGSVDAESVEVVSSPAEGLAKAAVTAVSRIKFKPGEVDGTAVRSMVAMPISYQLAN